MLAHGEDEVVHGGFGGAVVGTRDYRDESEPRGGDIREAGED